jgi:predicted GIY-YIG superfamily endonuclease
VGGPLAEAGATAPTGAGVYFFLDEQRRLLYVGKASTLRRRLQQHAKEPPTSAASKYARVRTVAWEELADDDAACAREADLIVAFQPAQNAAIAGERRWTYLVVEWTDDDDGHAALRLVSADDPPRSGGDVYGCFPHLGKGHASRPGIACSDGYAGLLRLLWATGVAPARPYPRAISGPSPPMEATVPVPAVRRPVLRRFLSGTSARLLADLRAGIDEVEPFLRPALGRDLDLARAFYDHGPVALRRLRLRHGLAAGPMARTTIESLLLAEVTASIGEVVVGGGSERARRRLP